MDLDTFSPLKVMPVIRHEIVTEIQVSSPVPNNSALKVGIGPNSSLFVYSIFGDLRIRGW